MTESQTFKKRSDFQSNDDYAVYVRENIQVRFEDLLLQHFGFWGQSLRIKRHPPTRPDRLG